MRLSEARVTVVGLGLMGGSAALALRGQVAALAGVDAHPDVARRAQALGLVPRATTDLAEALEGCDLTLLAVPVGAILDLLPRLGRDLPAPRLVLDFGSTKGAVVRAMADLPPEVDPIGGHPLCGKETPGPEAAEAGLFRGATFVLTPLERTSAAAMALAEDLVHALGARPLYLDAERHDHLLAWTSHLPYLLAVSLVACVARAAEREPAVWDLAASGFRDTSRLAASDLTMMLDILRTNRRAVAAAARAAAADLHHLADLLEASQDGRLREELGCRWEARRGFEVRQRAGGRP